MRRTPFLRAALLLSLAGLLWSTASQAAHPVYRANPEGPALRGYDTVAYFTEGRAVQGSSLYRHEWQDTEWYFSSAENRDLFAADPEKYAPQFGGYCAYALSKQRLYEGHPEVFVIEDGKLYFNNNSSVMRRWKADPEPFIDAATEAFTTIVGDRETAPKDAPAAIDD